MARQTTTKKTTITKKPAAAKKKTTAATKKASATTKKVATKVTAKAAAKKAAPVTKTTVAKKAAQAPMKKPVLVNKAKAASSKPAAQKSFDTGEYVVYPTHGVGKIMAIETQTIGGHEIKVFVIAFEKDKMTLRVPVGRAEAAGLRTVSSNDQITRAISTLKGRAKIARGMWSRRAQEYETKINSGNLVQIAEVVRDLHKNVDTSERSYSERMIYETALQRLVGEYAAAEEMAFNDANDKLLKLLRKQVAEQEAEAAA
jgi:CarD family transcriptional regulator